MTSLFVAAAFLCFLAGLTFLIRQLRLGATTRTHAAQLDRSLAAWGWLALAGLLTSGLVTLMAGDAGASTISYAYRIFWPRAGVDSWAVMQLAATHLQQHPDVPVYQAIFFEQQQKFQYPVTSLLLLDIPRIVFGADYATTILWLKVLSRLCVPLLGVAVASLLVQAASGGAEAQVRIPPRQKAYCAALGFLSAILFFPVASSESLGQIQTAITLAAALALLAWQRDRPWLAGIAIGLCCVFKPHWGIVVAWACLHRQWRFAGGASVTLGIFVAIAAAMYGWRNLWDYLSVVSYIGSHGETFASNQSANGLINRLLSNGSSEWLEHGFAPYHPVVHAVTFGTSILLIGFALLRNATRPPQVLDLALVMLSLTVASPIAWPHHYGVLLPIFAIALPAAMAGRPWGKATVPALWVAFILTGQTLTQLTDGFSASPLNLLQSTLYFGALMLLGLLYALTAARVPGRLRPPNEVAAPG